MQTADASGLSHRIFGKDSLRIAAPSAISHPPSAISHSQQGIARPRRVFDQRRQRGWDTYTEVLKTSLVVLANAKVLVQHTNIMQSVSIHQAKAQLSGLVESVEKKGTRVVLSRYGKPVAEITPYRKRKRSRRSPELAKISYTGDLTQPSEAEWDNA
ncbi:MAG: type II toxin-antitoxin system Phd/YefM family antitoxin [Opitutales bacterium]|nr:type II toxin-antitoxin system Phd/YefM family antitoxin [Opitutales bacterium]